MLQNMLLLLSVATLKSLTTWISLQYHLVGGSCFVLVFLSALSSQSREGGFPQYVPSTPLLFLGVLHVVR